MGGRTMKITISIFVSFVFAVVLIAAAERSLSSMLGPMGRYKLFLERDLQHISELLETYRTQHGEYPENAETWAESEEWMRSDSDFDQTFRGPWGNPLEYRRTDDGGWEITCLGADDTPGGDGRNADLTLSNHDDIPRWMASLPEPTCSQIAARKEFQTLALWAVLMSVTVGIGTYFQIRRKTSPFLLCALWLASFAVCLFLILMETASLTSGH